MIIKRNTHAPFRLPRILIKPEALRYEVEFTESCRYRFGTDDDADVNKLFGIAFITWGSFWFVLKSYYKVLVTLDWSRRKSLHHYNSIRWGWRYDALSGNIELLEYCYIKGVRHINYITYFIMNNQYELWADKRMFGGWSLHYDYVYLMPETWLCYELHPYFGGNNPAPHDMEIKMKRI